MASDKCWYACKNKTSEGYCRTTVCINPEHRFHELGVKTVYVKPNFYNSVKKKDIESDPDYGVGRFS